MFWIIILCCSKLSTPPISCTFHNVHIARILLKFIRWKVFEIWIIDQTYTMYSIYIYDQHRWKMRWWKSYTDTRVMNINSGLLYYVFVCVCMYENFVIFIHYNTNIAHSHDKLLYVFENWSKSVRKICQRINECKIISQLLFIIIIEYMLLNLTSLPLSSCYYAV